MNEGAPVRTVALMIIVTVVLAGLIGLFMIYCFAPSDYTYRATKQSRGACQSSTAIVRAPTVHIIPTAAAMV
jgi:FlaG/FlaF family flagellin (archaellin)